MSKKKIAVLSIFTVLLLVVGFFVNAKGDSLAIFKFQDTQVLDPNAKNNAYLADTQQPQINVSREGDYSYKSAVIPMLSTAEPYVEVDSWNYSGQANFNLYKANQENLLEYMVRDSNGKRTGSLPDVSSLSSIASFSKNIPSNEKLRVELPLAENGIWYMEIKVPGAVRSVFILRSDVGAVYKESSGEYLFWATNVKTKRSITGGTVRLINLNNSVSSFSATSIGGDGIAKLKVSPLADIALVETDSSMSLVPVNLRYYYGDWRRSSRMEPDNNRYFIFTDRPLYKPGDMVYFKSIIRERSGDSYTMPKGSAKAIIFRGWDEKKKIYEADIPISEFGSVSGEFKLPDDLKTDYYTVRISLPSTSNGGFGWFSNETTFTVDYYQKPEAYIDIETDSMEYVVRENIGVKISGNYYFGQPAAGQTVKYVVRQTNMYDYNYDSIEEKNRDINSGYYGYYGWSVVAEGEVVTGEKGLAVFNVPTKASNDPVGAQVYTIEAQLDNGTGALITARKNVLVYDGSFSIYRESSDYYSYRLGGEINVPFVLQSIKGGSVSGIELTGTPHWSTWRWENNKAIEEAQDLSPIEFKSDAAGKAILKMKPEKSGSYQITVSGKDNKGNLVGKKFYLWVAGENDPVFFGDNRGYFSVSPDKEKYNPGDVAKLKISAQEAGHDVLLSIEQNTIHQYQVVHMEGKAKTIEVKLTEADAPDVAVIVAGFSAKDFSSTYNRLSVSAESKRINVTLSPDLAKYGPGQDMKLKVKTQNKDGVPVPAEVAVWGVDKALLEMTDVVQQDIFDSFWGAGYASVDMGSSQHVISDYSAGGMGGCFDGETDVLMSDGSNKKIKDMKVGDSIMTRESEIDSKLVSAKVINVHEREVDGYVIINGSLRITPNHFVWTDSGWKEAGSLSIGEFLIDSDKRAVMVDSIEWHLGKFKVYNLDVDDKHTFFANNLWVHNGKGGGSNTPRSTFSDTAFWNPRVLTNSKGEADVTFTLPDNLTTWVISGVADNTGAMFGQANTEIMVTKDVVVRPILPILLRIGDDLSIETVVHNFTDKDRTFKVSLQFDSGKIDSKTEKEVEIKSGQFTKVSWDIRPDKENEKAKITFSAIDVDDSKYSDAVTQEIPVQAMGFWLKGSRAGSGNSSVGVKLFENSDVAKAKIELSLSPTIFGPVSEAMEYLLDYPYGCIEQTTSRMMPVVLAKSSPELFKDALADKNLDQMFLVGQQRLAALQMNDGGWSWSYLDKSNPFVTAYVLENLIYAKSLGYAVDQEILDKVSGFIKSEDGIPYNDPMKQYSRTLLGIDKGNDFISIDGSFGEDMLALAVINNVALGNNNPNTNGLNKLLSLAKQEGDRTYWEAGSQEYFGSRDASTALAIRAIIAGGGDIRIAEKGIRYLLNSRTSSSWHNSFATAQVIRAMTDYAKKTGEANPNYSFKVYLDGKEIKNGSFSSIKDGKIAVAIPADQIKKDGSKISIEQNGSGNLHWTLNSKEFIKGNGFKGQDNGLMVKREYINEKKPGAPIGIGDSVLVKISISGLAGDSVYGVIEDQLPSGMVPIARTYKRVNMGIGERSFMSDYDGGDREATATGMQILLSSVASGSRDYFYRARAVVSGNFVAPPASSELMYEPSINGKTAIAMISIGDKPTIVDPGSMVSKIVRNWPLIACIIILLALIVIGIVLIIKKKKNGAKLDLSATKDKIKTLLRR